MCRKSKLQPVGILIGIFGQAALTLAAPPTQPASGHEYLSDVCYGIAICPNQMGVDSTPYLVWPKQEPGKPIRMGGKDYAKGLGMWPPCQMNVAVDGDYDLFEAEVGVQSQPYAGGTATMQVEVDGRVCFDSGAMTENDPPRPVRIPLAGAKEMRLICGGTAWCNWANARLRRTGSTTTQSADVDMAPFARVVTFDPHRKHGFSGDCTKEGFPARDVFLESDLVANDAGVWAAPVTNGLACIGLQWMEQRRLKEVSIRFASPVPPPAGARVECWIGARDYVNGESNWQGGWQPLKGRIEERDESWLVRCAEETRRIRWILPATEPVRVRQLRAVTFSNWDQADLLFQLEQAPPNAHGEIEVYNGRILAPAGSDDLRRDWDLSRPLHLRVNYARQRPWGSDRTVLRVKLPGGAFAVAVDDLVPGKFTLPPGPRPAVNTAWKTADDVVEDLHRLGCVYVKDYGFFATQDPPALTLEQYKQKIAGRRTVLEQVRSMPDQNYAQALEKTYDPRQSASATMLSLAAGNRKFIVDREGAVHYGPVTQFVAIESYPFQLTPQFGSGKNEGLARALNESSWLPVPVTSVSESGIVYRQRTYVAPFGVDEKTRNSPRLGRHALGVAEFTIENTSAAPAPATLKLAFKHGLDTPAPKPATLVRNDRRVLASAGGPLIGVAEPVDMNGWEEEISEGVLTLKGTLPGKSSVQYVVYLPGWELPSGEASFKDPAVLLAQTKKYWQDLIGTGMRFDVPDAQVQNLVYSSLVHCWITARNSDDGRLVEPWIAPNCYGALDSESQMITRGMDAWGQHDYARRSLEFWLGRCPAGFFVSGYTYGPGTGQFLWTLMDHYRLTLDREWLKRFSPQVTAVCNYIAGQTEKTRRVGPNGDKLPEYGMMTPGRGADWGHWGYIFSISGHCYAGLSRAAQVMRAFDAPAAERWGESAQRLREEICRAFRWTQARTPVVPLRDGNWVPGYSYEVYAPGPIGQFFPNFSIWMYDVLLGPEHLGPQGVLDPAGKEMAWMADHLEDIQFLKGWEGLNTHPDYLAKRDADPFNWGGVLKGQPYYLRHAEVLAARDDVKPFIRNWINTAVTSINRENLTVWENTWGCAAWDKTHETGNLLYQARLMLVMERGRDLWLAPFVTADWMQDGKVVRVDRAPTLFGPVSYRIESHVTEGRIEATISRPKSPDLDAIVIRLRHPEGKRIRAVTVNGQPSAEFDPAREFVRVPAGSAVHVKASY